MIMSEKIIESICFVPNICKKKMMFLKAHKPTVSSRYIFPVHQLIFNLY